MKTENEKLIAGSMLGKKINRIWKELSLDSEERDSLTNAFKLGLGQINLECEGIDPVSIWGSPYPPVVGLTIYKKKKEDTVSDKIYQFEIQDIKFGEPDFAKNILNHGITSISFLNFVMIDNITEKEVYFLMKISPSLANYRTRLPLVGILFTLDNGFQFVIGTEICEALPAFSIFLPSDINKDLEKFIVRNQ